VERAMNISKHYEENIIVGSYQSAKIGITITSDKDLKSAEEIEEYSGKLNALAKKIVRKELAKVKAEKEEEHDNNT
jgi:hypothetical protein